MSTRHLPRPGEGILWRERTSIDAALPALETTLHTVPSSWRCHATDLLRGDCEMKRTEDSVYCYYHDKLQTGLTSPHVDTISVEVADYDENSGGRKVRAERQFVERTDCYPVWPLPKRGYVLMAAHPARVAA